MAAPADQPLRSKEADGDWPYRECARLEWRGTKIYGAGMAGEADMAGEAGKVDIYGVVVVWWRVAE